MQQLHPCFRDTPSLGTHAALPRFSFLDNSVSPKCPGTCPCWVLAVWKHKKCLKWNGQRWQNLAGMACFFLQLSSSSSPSGLWSTFITSPVFLPRNGATSPRRGGRGSALCRGLLQAPHAPSAAMALPFLSLRAELWEAGDPDLPG